ncbi:MAG TPA: HDOD domain-containing protein [Acidobacteriaceae bacterium]|nr:HDOD domain-containing protein [Acidobacteriaceae bacterium]
MLKRIEFPAFAAFNPVAMYQPSPFEVAQEPPPVPVLPETLLLLELEAQERCIDLRRVSRIVLADLGATMQVLRLSARELSDFDGPVRIEDCISELGIWPCIEAMTAETSSQDIRYAAINNFWRHSRDVAQHARLIAEEMLEVNPDQAYMAGLLHEIASLPALLGWRDRWLEESSYNAPNLVARWSLPRFVAEFFNEGHSGASSASWPEIVRMAHRLSVQSCIHPVAAQENRSMVYAGLIATAM